MYTQVNVTGIGTKHTNSRHFIPVKRHTSRPAYWHTLSPPPPLPFFLFLSVWLNLIPVAPTGTEGKLLSVVVVLLCLHVLTCVDMCLHVFTCVYSVTRLHFHLNSLCWKNGMKPRRFHRDLLFFLFDRINNCYYFCFVAFLMSSVAALISCFCF